MSCTTDRTWRRGSVLMEFVIVLPIYLTFLGAVFVTGEMALKSIHLASSERSAVHEQCDANWSFPAFQLACLRQFSQGVVDAVTGTSRSLVADADFNGSWAMFMAGKATDVYQLPTWTRSWLQYPARIYGAPDVWGVAKTIFSKDDINASHFNYNFYTYLRVPGTRGKGYRSWAAKELSGTLGEWTKVYNEPYLPESKDGKALNGSGSATGRGPLSDPDKKSDYDRYGQFVDWSD